MSMNQDTVVGKFKRNPIRNSVISVLSGQKPGTKIISGILESILYFLKANRYIYIYIVSRNNTKNISHGNARKETSKFREMCKHNWQIKFYQNLLSTFGVVRNYIF